MTDSSPSYHVLSVEVPAPAAAESADWLRENIGVEPVEVAKPGAPRVYLECYFEDETAALLAQAAVEAGLDGARCSMRFCPARDWTTFWRHHFKPHAVGRRIWIFPDWDPAPPPEGRTILLRVNPGLSFGTGEHFTTRFCLEAMDGLFEQGVPTSVFDAGCGSAILAIAAHKLGCRDILAVDHDPLSVLSAGENLALNAIPAGGIDVRQMDLLMEWPARSFDHVYANLFDEMLIQLAPRLAEATGRFLVTTGIRETMGDAVCAALMAQGLNEIRRDGDGEWCGMVFSR